MLKTVIVLISHQTPPEVLAMCGAWQRLNPEALIHVAYGGPEDAFEALAWPGRTFIRDPRLRTRDHQRERQSYRGIMREVVGALSGSGVARVLMVECDVVPLRAGLVEFLRIQEAEQQAQVLGVGLRRVDGTSHPHFLAHQSHRCFQAWLDSSIRPDKDVVLMMLGCLTWWTWEAFAATAGAAEPMPVYLELAMPTTAHHLGFRVRNLPLLEADLEPVGELEHLLPQRQSEGRWVLHPCKQFWRGEGNQREILG